LAFQKDSVSWIGHNIKTGVVGFFSYREAVFFSYLKGDTCH
jgi:hypothetical protein